MGRLCQTPRMICMTILYPKTDDSTFDMDYYINAHMLGVCRDALGPALKGVQVEEGLGGAAPGAPATYVAVGPLLFDSVEAFQAAFAPAAAAIQGDIPNYTDVAPIIQVSLIRV